MPECIIGRLKINVEFPLLLMFFAFMLSDSIKTNLYIYRTCYVTLGYNKSECALLGGKNISNETAELEKIVEPYANIISMSSGIVDALFSAIICFFVGPWSDRFGRKLFLVLPLIGFFFGYLILIVCTVLTDLSPWYFSLTIIPLILTGGFSTYLTVALCYISDISTEANRGVRMGIFEAILALGIFLGNLCSSYIFASVGYAILFGISAICCLIAIFFTIFFIPESIEISDTPEESSLKSLFQLQHVKDMVCVTFKKRENFTRAIILCCVVMLTLYIFAVNSDSAVIFLYLREKLHWSLEKYTLYSAAHNITWILGTYIGVYVLHKLCKMAETSLIFLGFGSMLFNSLILGLAVKDWHVYIGAVVRCLGGVLSPMIRTIVSKLVPSEEIGKIFSLIVAAESLCGMLGSPLYTTIYNATLKSDPSIFNFITVGIYLIQIIIVLAVIIMQRVKTSDGLDEFIINSDNEDYTQNNIEVE